MAESPIVTRIRKLLAMTEEAGCSPAEAAEAMRRANELMTAHNIAVSEIPTGEPEPITEEEIILGDQAPERYDWCLKLAVLVAAIFGTQAYRGQSARTSRGISWRVIIVGEPTDVAVSSASLNWLIELGKRGWQESWEASRKNVPYGMFRVSWLAGFVTAVQGQVDRVLRDREQSATQSDASMFAIVACKMDAIDRYTRSQGSFTGVYNMKSARAIDEGAYLDGMKSGESASLTPMKSMGGPA